MPNYAKYLRDMVSKRKRIEEFKTVAVTEECIPMLHNKLPLKQTDPRSFVIPCIIGRKHETKALCDLQANINLMPKAVFDKLGIGQAKPTSIMLKLADHSFVQLKAISKTS
ncbi:hypothetical protein HRI_000123200 [Hibiscus trionum]|uniref:Uncharacterized protein n=1 Tax=Hibiscus trionum TaxID=183268 RepID=A0A9W7GRW3_HIBTR|nr:hypothetical protein HRI_000123200 [Hibiscus trionum]